MQWLANLRLHACLPWLAVGQTIVIVVVFSRVHRHADEHSRQYAVKRLDTRNQSSLPALNYPARRRLSDARLPRTLTVQEEKVFMELLRVLSRLMTDAGVEFIMCDGTLLGSYMFHGFIPWDDDADIMVNIKDISKVKTVLSNTSLRREYDAVSYPAANNTRAQYNEYHVSALHGSFHRKLETDRPQPVTESNPNNTTLQQASSTKAAKAFHKFKFFKVRQSLRTGYPWRWPFVDVKYYSVASSTGLVSNIDRTSQIFTVRHEVFYPITMRPFGNLWLPAPKDTQGYLRKKYKAFRCTRGTWSHKMEQRQPGKQTLCSGLMYVYPFVWRRKEESGLVVEELRLGDLVLQTVVLNQTYHAKLRQGYAAWTL